MIRRIRAIDAAVDVLAAGAVSPTSAARQTRTSVRMLVAVATVGLATACGSSGSATPAPAPDPDALVLRVDAHGGLLPPVARAAMLPLFSIYGDGRMLFPASDDWPDPALQSRLLSPHDMSRVLAAAAKAGLREAGTVSLGNDHVMDAGFTRFTLALDHGTSVVEAEALGIERERGRRGDLVALQSLLESLAAEFPSEAHLPAGVLVFAAPGASADVPQWPLSGDPGAGQAVTDEFGFDVRCTVARGTDIGTVLAAYADAADGTVWASHGTTYDVGVRPLLPEEAGCPAET